MRRRVEITGAGGGWMRRAAVAALAAGLAVAWGCQSATQSKLSEYEKLVARRRSESLAARQQPAQAGVAAPTAAERAAAEKAAAEKAAAEKAAAKKAEAERIAAEKAAKKAAEQQAAEEKAAAKRAAEERAAAEKAEKAAREAAEREAAAAREAAERAAREEAERAAAAVSVVAPPAAPAMTPPPAPATDARGDSAAGVYRLAKGDIVQIALRGIPESQLLDDSLDEFGMISLPFLNEIYAEGLTASELEQRIRTMYRDAQIYPNVTVQVQVPTRYYFMQGEIRGPGRVQLVTATRLSQAIAAAGGGTEFWNGKVQLRRNGEIFRKIKNAKRLEKTPEDDVWLEPGDIVELMRSIL